MMKAVPSIPAPDERRLRFWLGTVVLAWGVQAIVTQSLLLREVQVLMFGSEFAWGVVLFAWLLGVAVGAAVGGWAARRPQWATVGLIVVLLALGAGACVELWMIRGARSWFGLEPGELFSLPMMVLAAAILVSPCGVLVGIAFPLACSIGNPPDGGRPGGAGPLGRVYALESAGSLIGGAAFSFWAVEHLAPIETAMICAALVGAASAGLLAASGRGRYGSTILVVLALSVLATATLWGDDLDRRLVRRRWQNVAPGYELLSEMESRYQNLAVGRRAGQFSLYCDGYVTADFPDPYTFVPMAHFWMCQHPAPQRILLLGGGAEGLLAEILSHPIEHVDFVEPDPRQIELIKPYLAAADLRALQDHRVTVHHADARFFLKTQRHRFDLVVARLPEPTSAQRSRFYTDSFFAELRRAMTERSVLCMTAAATPAELSSASAEYLASLRETLQTAFPYVTIGWGNPAHVLAATETRLISLEPVELARRYNTRGVRSELFDPLWFEGATDWLNPEKVRRRAAELDAVSQPEVSTDLKPAVYMQRLALWERMTSGSAAGGAGIIQRLRSIQLLDVVVLAAAVGGIVFVIGRMSCGHVGSAPRTEMRWSAQRTLHRSPGEGGGRYQWFSWGAVVLSVATTGFATMALSIIWLFAFQNLYGYVYQRIGWIIAVFMGGLVIGCGVVSVRSRRVPDGEQLDRYLWRRLIAVDALLALLALSVPFVLPVLGAVQDTEVAFTLVEWAVSIMVALAGVLGGGAFALAGGMQLAAYEHAGSAAGSVVGADHAGACVGALLTGLVLVPVFGTATASLLLVGIKLASGGLLLIARYLSRPV